MAWYSALVSAGAHAFKAAGGVTTEAFFRTVGRDADYWFNTRHQTVTAGPAEAIEAFYAGTMDRNDLEWTLSQHGIDWWSTRPKGDDPRDRQVWKRVVASKEPHLEPDMVRRLERRGYLSHDKADQHLSRAGLYTSDMRFRFYLDYEPLSPGEYIASWLRGYIDTPTLRQKFVWMNLDDKDEGELLRKLALEIPGPADLVHFAVREVWDPDITEAFGHNEEFRAQFQYWMLAQGAGGDARTPAEVAAGADAFSWAQAHWRAHWVTISPSQSYEMLHRLRGDPEDPASWRVPGVKPFTLKDVRLALKANDYPPPFRDRLAAISYNVLGRVDVRRMINLDLVTAAQAVELFQDQGYTADDAQRLVDMSFALRDQSRAAKVKKRTWAKVLAAYEAGVIDQDDVARQLYRLTLLNETQALDYDLLPPADQLREAQADPFVAVAVEDAVSEYQLKQVKEWQATLKRGFISGRFTEGQVIQQLQAVGVRQGWIDSALRRWKWQLDSGARFASVAQIGKWLQEGAITIDEYAARLTNLHYTPRDISLMLIQAQRDSAVARQKAAAAAAKTLAAKQAALARAAKAAQAEHNRLRSELARHGSPTSLVKWYAQETIGDVEFMRRLAALDWPLADAERLLEEARKKRDAKTWKLGGPPQRGTIQPGGQYTPGGVPATGNVP